MAARRRTPPPKRASRATPKRASRATPKRPRKTTKQSPKAKSSPGRAKPKAAPRKPKSGGAKARRAARPVRRRRLSWRIAKWSFILVFWLAVLGAGFVGYYAYDLPDTGRLTGPETPLSVTVLAADGSTVADVGEMWGELVPVAEMAPVLPRAVLAIEDRRFFEHGGIDAFGVIRGGMAERGPGPRRRRRQHHLPAGGEIGLPLARAQRPAQDSGGDARLLAGTRVQQGGDPSRSTSTAPTSAPAPTAWTPPRGAISAARRAMSMRRRRP